MQASCALPEAPVQQLAALADVAVRLQHPQLLANVTAALTLDRVRSLKPDDLVQLLLTLHQTNSMDGVLGRTLLDALPVVLGDGTRVEDATGVATLQSLLVGWLQPQQSQQQQSRDGGDTSGLQAQGGGAPALPPAAVPRETVQQALTALESSRSGWLEAGIGKGLHRPHDPTGAALYRRYSWLRRRFLYLPPLHSDGVAAQLAMLELSPNQQAELTSAERAVSVLEAYVKAGGTHPWVLNRFSDAIDARMG